MYRVGIACNMCIIHVYTEYVRAVRPYGRQGENSDNDKGPQAAAQYCGHITGLVF